MYCKTEGDDKMVCRLHAVSRLMALACEQTVQSSSQANILLSWLLFFKEEKGESDDEIVPGRESDLKLTDVPEDMREAVQGS